MDTNGLIPSIGLNILIMNNAAPISLTYIEQVIDTINNIINVYQEAVNQDKLKTGIVNPSNKSLIKTNITSIKQMQDIINVLHKLVDDIILNKLK